MWNPLSRRFNSLYMSFRKMPPDKKKEIVDAVIKKKCIEKKKPDGEASCVILLEEIKNHVDRR